MEQKLITGLLYTQLDDEVGPNPLVWIGDIPQSSRLYISIKTITILSGESGLIPESLVILPFPSLNSKGIIKYLKWDDPNRRGGIGQSAITLLFREIDDVIFYKYISYLDSSFDEAAKFLSNLEVNKAHREAYVDVLKKLEYSLSQFLAEFKRKEISEAASRAFPSQKIKEENLVDYKFKIVICGDPSVGKTSLILRFTDNAFRRHYIPTLGVHVSDKIFQVKDSYVQLVLWDIAGQQKFEIMRQQFYLGSDAIFLIFDLTNHNSFESVSNWYFDIQNQLKDKRKMIGYIVGNKKDLADDIKIVSDKGLELANYLNLSYIETSALTGENVEKAFTNIAQILYDSIIG
ncbi:MAG: GTP-binding protein [Candidatus Lokiarchaeota archaeon]|nr:GTP-binding protein [Candidatus Lokiarchaeota archaeon]